MAEVRAWRLALFVGLGNLILPPFSGRSVRGLLWRLGGAQVARGAQVSRGVLVGHANISLGAGSYLGPEVALLANSRSSIMIGARVAVGPRTSFFVEGHDIGDEHKRAGAVTHAPITVGDGAWIGAGCIITPGVIIGAGAVVAAGTLVREDVKPHTVVGGNPMRVLRELADRAAA